MSLWLTFGVLSFAAHGGSAVRIFYVRRLSPGISQISLGLLVRTMANDGEAVRQNLALGTLATQQSKITMNWFGKKKDSGSSSAPSGGGGGGGGDPSQTIVKLREAVATQEKR